MSGEIVRLWFKQGGNCYYCNRTMIFHSVGNGETMPDTQATIEHVYSKYDIRRLLDSKKVVAACRRCNMMAAKRDISKIHNKYGPKKQRRYRGMIKQMVEGNYEKLKDGQLLVIRWKVSGESA